jgi:exopolysaccharide production protein ExoQ
VTSVIHVTSHPARLLGRTPPPSPVSHSAADHAFNLLEHLLATVGLLLCSGALFWLYASASASRATPLGEANALFQTIIGSVYLLALAMLLPRWRDAALLLARNKALLLLLAVAAASFLWAAEPAVALRRALALLLTFGFALWLAIRFAPGPLMRLIVAALLVGSLASIAAGMLVPEIGKHVEDSHAGLWRGVFGHKNVMGRIMSFAVVAGLLLLTTTRGSRLQALTVVVLAAVLVVTSGSASASATTLLALMTLPVCKWLSRTRLPLQVFVPVTMGAGVLLGLTIMALAEPLLALLGRDITLSGRIRLWELALDEGLRRPLLGAGFRTFWLESGPGGTVMTLVSWGDGNIGNGHNAYLDLWLELGLIGLLAYAVVLKEAAARIASLMQNSDQLSVWLAVVLVHLSAYAMTERVLLEHSDLSWLLFMAFFLQATPALAPARKAVS